MTGTAESHGVVVGVDGSAESEAAIVWAAQEAAQRRWPIILLHAVAPVVAGWPPIGPMRMEVTEWQRENARHVVEQAQKTLQANRTADGAPSDARVVYADVVTTLVDATRHARLFVVGGRGVGVAGRGLLGSVSTALLHHARCPIAVIRAPEGGVPVDDKAPVLVGIDGSKASERATEWAFEEASRRCISLVALHAWSDIVVYPVMGVAWPELRGQGEAVLADHVSAWQRRYPEVPVESKLVCDRPAHWLIEESERCQLIVVGSHGRGAFTGLLLGSVSRSVVQSAKVPVIVVRG